MYNGGNGGNPFPRATAAAEKGKAKLRGSPPPPQPHRVSNVQHILNAAAPIKPFSYMSLLTAPDDEVDLDSLSNHRQQIDHMIYLHSENLRQALGGAVENHLCEIHRKHKERETELLARNDELEMIVERQSIRMRYLERAKRTLTERLREANAYMAQEEAEESSFPDPDRVGPIVLECKVCARELATVMLWPCRHVCVCPRCEPGARVCPVCRAVKTHCVELQLPIN